MPYSHCYSLLAGAALALWRKGPARQGLFARLEKLSCAPAVGVGAVVVIVVQAVATHSGRIAMGVWYPIVVAATMALIVHCLDGGFAGRFFALRPVVFVGSISYALYLWHTGVYAALNTASHPMHLFLAAPIIVLLAWVSTRFVERPVRRAVGKRLGRQPLELPSA
jgi:peptidoglycan/LPS O-acetylase OafA/YrhL